MSSLLLFALLAAAPRPQALTAPPPPAPAAQSGEAKNALMNPALQDPAGNTASLAKAYAVSGQKTAYANHAVQTSSDGAVNMARFGLFLLVIGALGLGYWFIKKRRLPFAGSALIHKVAHSQIVPGQGVALVEVDGRMLVLGTGPGGLKLLYHYPVDNSEDLAEPDFSQSMQSDEASELRARLKNLGQHEQSKLEINLSRTAQDFSIDSAINA